MTDKLEDNALHPMMKQTALDWISYYLSDKLDKGFVAHNPALIKFQYWDGEKFADYEAANDKQT